MFPSFAYDKDGFLRTEPVSDRCPRYVPRANTPNLNRCACCVSFDPDAAVCRSPENKYRPSPRAEDAQGEKR